MGYSLEMGGEEIAEVEFENGDTQTVRSGQGGSMAFGAEAQIPNIDFLMFQATAGIKYVTNQAENANIRLTRFPLEFMAHFAIIPDLSIGGGLSYHTDINLKGENLVEQKKFDNAAGPVLEAAYKGFGLRYSNLNYTDQYGDKYDASALGFYYKFTFNVM